MAWPNQHKQDTRQRILDSAIRLFSQHGYDNVPLSRVMQDAGLTHGAFYAHFASKQALYAEAIREAAGKSALAKMRSAGSDEADDLVQLLHAYLSEAHAIEEQSPCPLAFLATDVANRQTEVRCAYTRVFRRLVALTGSRLPSTSPHRRERALALAAMMVGGVAVARALDEPRLAQALLGACRQVGTELIEHSDCSAATDDRGERL
jgi:TetR/AcrR family transcriptional repressor of nem operon